MFLWIGFYSKSWVDDGNWDIQMIPGAGDMVTVAFDDAWDEAHVSTSETIGDLNVDNAGNTDDWGVRVLAGGWLTVVNQIDLTNGAVITVDADADLATSWLNIDATSHFDNYGTTSILGGTFTGTFENYGRFLAEGTITGDVEQDNYVLGGAQFIVGGYGSTGTLAVDGNLKLTEGSIVFDFSSSSADAVSVTGNLDFTLDDIFLYDVAGYKFASGATFTLIDVAGTLNFGNPYEVTVSGQHADFAYFVGTLAGSNDIVFRTFNSGATGGAAVLDATGGTTALQYLFQSYDGDDSVYGGLFGPYWQRIVNVTSIIGTSHNDVVSAFDFDEGPPPGPARNLTIQGAAGKDSLTGGFGNDSITGGADSDVIVGGGGSDTVYFSGARSNYLIGYSDGDGLYTVIHKNSGSDGTDTVSEVETFVFNGVSYTAAQVTPPTNVTGTLKISEGKSGTVGALTAVDPTNTTGFTWSLINNAGGRFAINSSGVVTVANKWKIDREQATSHAIVVRVTDADGNFLDKSMTVSVLDVTKEDLTGSTSADKLYGGVNVDKFRGGDGNDTFRGGGGKDVLDGGAGNDTADYADKSKVVEVTLNRSTNVVVKVNGVAEDTIKNIERVTGGSANDKLTGDALANVFTGNGGKDTLLGSTGNDSLYGGTGDDSLDGGTGNDVLSGGAGKDTLKGGTGTDYFLFDAALGTTNIDRISDFKPADDTIRLDADIFDDAGPLGALKAAAFKANTTGQATDGSDRITYETDAGRLFYDRDGLGGAARIQIAVLTDNPKLTVADFVIV